MFEPNRSQKTVALISAMVIIIALSFLGIGYLYIQNIRLEDDKARLQDEVSNLESAVSNLESEQTSLESQLSSLQSEISTLRTDYNNLQDQYDAIYEARYELGYSGGYSDGYDIGYSNGYDLGYSLGFDEGSETGYAQGVEDGAGRGYNIRDPTYQEALQFIEADQTDKNEYDEESYNCFHFTADFKGNAFQAGYRCGFVYVEFVEGAHAIVCFNTIGYGIIFIEPQSDDIVTLTIGQPYWDRTEYEPPDYDDTIVTFTIVW